MYLCQSWQKHNLSRISRIKFRDGPTFSYSIVSTCRRRKVSVRPNHACRPGARGNLACAERNHTCTCRIGFLARISSKIPFLTFTNLRLVDWKLAKHVHVSYGAVCSDVTSFSTSDITGPDVHYRRIGERKYIGK